MKYISFLLYFIIYVSFGQEYYLIGSQTCSSSTCKIDLYSGTTVNCDINNPFGRVTNVYTVEQCASYCSKVSGCTYFSLYDHGSCNLYITNGCHYMYGGSQITGFYGLCSVLSKDCPDDCVGSSHPPQCLSCSSGNCVDVSQDYHQGQDHDSGQDYDHRQGQGHDSGQDHDYRQGQDHDSGQDHDYRQGQGHDSGQDHDNRQGQGHDSGQDHDYRQGQGHDSGQDHDYRQGQNH